MKNNLQIYLESKNIKDIYNIIDRYMSEKIDNLFKNKICIIDYKLGKIINDSFVDKLIDEKFENIIYNYIINYIKYSTKNKIIKFKIDEKNNQIILLLNH